MRHHATQHHGRLSGVASRLVFALAVTALAGCGDRNATGPEDDTADLAAEVGPVDIPAADLGDGRSAAAPTAASSSAVTAAATRLPKSFFVNPGLGSDANPGTQLKPFKTLAKGLSLAIAGDTMRLAAGVYSAAGNGEKFTTSTGARVASQAETLLTVLSSNAIPRDLCRIRLTICASAAGAQARARTNLCFRSRIARAWPAVGRMPGTRADS
jgi:hypothetical protein